MRKFKLGIVGAGSIVETNHLPAIRVAEQAEISWIYDKNPSRAALVAKMYGIPVLPEGSVERALAEVDICLLATPYGVRKPYIEWCKRAGTALVVEKPFAFSREEHLDYCSGFKEWEIGVNFQRRFYRSVTTLRRIVDTAIFGKLLTVKFNQGNFSLKGGSGYLSDANLAGGGVIAESAIHSLDILLWIARAQAVRVDQMRSLHANRLDYDSIFSGEMITAEGRTAVYCEISTLRNLDNGLELEFENARIGCDLAPDAAVYIKKCEREGPDFVLLPVLFPEDLLSSATRINEAFLLFWQQFFSGLDSQEPNPTSAYTSLLTSSWIAAIYKSMNLT
jgi:predicted dehydrogenase